MPSWYATLPLPRNLPFLRLALPQSATLCMYFPVPHPPMRKTNIIYKWLTILALVMTLPAPAAETTSNSFTIGLFLPPDKSEAQSLKTGAEQALREYQKAGVPVQLLARGRTGQWGAESDEAAEMVLIEKARALISPADVLTSHLLLQVAGRTRIPVISLSSQSSVTGAGIPWMAALAPDDERQARFLFAALGDGAYCSAGCWAVLLPEGRAGEKIKEGLQSAAQQSGVRLAPIVEAPADDAALQRAVETIVAAGPVVVLIWLPPDTAGKAVRKLRSSAFKGALAGHTLLRSPAFIESAGPAAEGMTVATWQKNQEDLSLLERLPPAIQADETALYAYDAMRLLVEHFQRLPAGAKDHADFPLSAGLAGASGRLQFDQWHRRTGNLDLQTCRQGRFQSIISKQGKP